MDHVLLIPTDHWTRYIRRNVEAIGFPSARVVIQPLF